MPTWRLKSFTQAEGRSWVCQKTAFGWCSIFFTNNNLYLNCFIVNGFCMCIFVHLCSTCCRNFHVWVECWMRRPDLGVGFDGWQIVDPTPQEKSGGRRGSKLSCVTPDFVSWEDWFLSLLVLLGTYCCGPCPVAAIQRRCLGARYDVPFICASMDADVIQLVVRDGLVVGRTVDTESVGRLIYTKRVGSDSPENLTQIYKGSRSKRG